MSDDQSCIAQLVEGLIFSPEVEGSCLIQDGFLLCLESGLYLDFKLGTRQSLAKNAIVHILTLRDQALGNLFVFLQTK